MWPAQCQRDQSAGDRDPLKVGQGIETRSLSRENEGSGGGSGGKVGGSGGEVRKNSEGGGTSVTSQAWPQ